MNWARTLAFGMTGALLGGAIWVAIGYYTGYELGFLAIGVGAACGIGTALGANGRAGVAGGILAASLAIVSIVVARYFIVRFSLMDMARQAMAEDGSIDSGEDEYWVAVIADRLIENMGEDAEYLEWPIDDESLEDDSVANDYPAEVWAEALGTWRAMSMTEREQFCAVARNEWEREAEDGMQVAAGIVTLISCFRPMSLLFLAMAVGTAYKVAANSRPIEQAAEPQAGTIHFDDDRLHATPSWHRAAGAQQAGEAAPPAPHQHASTTAQAPRTTPGQNDAQNSFFIPGLGPTQTNAPKQRRGPSPT